MDEGGLRKKKGCLGRVLLSSLTWSLARDFFVRFVGFGEKLGMREGFFFFFWKKGEGGGWKCDERVVPAYADDFSGVGFDGCHRLDLMAIL